MVEKRMKNLKESSAILALKRAQIALFDCTKEIGAVESLKERVEIGLRGWKIEGGMIVLPMSPELLSILPQERNESVRDIPGGVR